jgi:hypothetical protein
MRGKILCPVYGVKVKHSKTEIVISGQRDDRVSGFDWVPEVNVATCNGEYRTSSRFISRFAIRELLVIVEVVQLVLYLHFLMAA